MVSVETTRDVEWATYTCTLGFQVFGEWRLLPSPSLCLRVVTSAHFCGLHSSGLWPDGSDGTDVNAVYQSNDKSLLATGDDFGKVHLFSHPCSQFRVRPSCVVVIKLLS